MSLSDTNTHQGTSRMKIALAALAAASALGFGLEASAQAQPQARAAQPAASAADQSFQGNDLFGRPMYTRGPNPVNVGDTNNLLRAVAAARADYQREMTIDSATWYGRLLAYQGLHREAIDVYTTALRRFPNSPKLLRHRAHRYFNTRQFDKSIEDGLRSAKLYEGQPLEREKLGPDYFPSTPDIVQFYTYYHLGHAYFAKHDYDNAAKWFGKSAEIGSLGGAPDETASRYWQYLSLARGQRIDDANKVLADYRYTLRDMATNREGNNYFDGIQLFKELRDPNDFYTDRDSGKAFSTADGMKASSSYSIANYHLIRGEREKAKEYLRRAMDIETWSFFARIQAEADWVQLYGSEKP